MAARSFLVREAGVSRSWLYTQTDIKDEIRRLRDQGQHQPSAPIPSAQRATDDSLRQRLELANRRNCELADENQRLRRQLAHALGQLRDHGRLPTSRTTRPLQFGNNRIVLTTARRTVAQRRRHHLQRKLPGQ